MLAAGDGEGGQAGVGRAEWLEAPEFSRSRLIIMRRARHFADWRWFPNGDAGVMITPRERKHRLDRPREDAPALSLAPRDRGITLLQITRPGWSPTPSRIRPISTAMLR